MSEPQTIIIGAGLSGLAAGIRLAYFDRPVTILERHTTIGGLNSFYRLRGRNHDVGLHAVTNYAEPGTKTGPLSKLLRQLRLSWDDFALKPQFGSTVVFPGHTLAFANDHDEFTESVAASFPDQIDGFRRLFEQIESHDELDLSIGEQSAREVLGEYLTDPMLIDMLFCPVMFYGSPTPHDMDFSQFVIMYKALFVEGFGRPHAGVRPILKALVRRFRELGGVLRLRCGVREIVTDDHRVVGVTLDDGEEIPADNVLSSAGSAETFELCGQSRELASEEFRRAVEPGVVSFMETIFDLDVPPVELNHPETIVFYNHAERFRYAPPTEPLDLASGIVCSPNNFRYEEPLKENRIRITALADPDFWTSQPDEETYIAQKEEWARQLVAEAIRVIPDFREHITDTDIFTPRTIIKYTGHHNGAVYGAPHKIRDGRTHLPNLFLCGTDQGFLGIVGSLLSGITIANLHLLR